MWQPMCHRLVDVYTMFDCVVGGAPVAWRKLTIVSHITTTMPCMLVNHVHAHACLSHTCMCICPASGVEGCRGRVARDVMLKPLEMQPPLTCATRPVLCTIIHISVSPSFCILPRTTAQPEATRRKGERRAGGVVQQKMASERTRTHCTTRHTAAASSNITTSSPATCPNRK
jgi:hypothetical protein